MLVFASLAHQEATAEHHDVAILGRGGSVVPTAVG
jgi:hypothetical protein